MFHITCTFPQTTQHYKLAVLNETLVWQQARIPFDTNDHNIELTWTLGGFIGWAWKQGRGTNTKNYEPKFSGSTSSAPYQVRQKGKQQQQQQQYSRTRARSRARTRARTKTRGWRWTSVRQMGGLQSKVKRTGNAE